MPNVYRCAPRHATDCMQEVNCTNRTYISMFPLPIVWFKHGLSVSCSLQALFPFNSMDVVLSLGSGGSARAIIYCLFSRQMCKSGKFYFFEYILKYYVYSFLCVLNASDPCPYCEPLGKKSRNIGEDVMLWQGNDPRVSLGLWTINAYRTGKCASLVMKSITLTFSLIRNLFLLRQWATQANLGPSRVYQAQIINYCVEWLCYSICVIFNIIE